MNTVPCLPVKNLLRRTARITVIAICFVSLVLISALSASAATRRKPKKPKQPVAQTKNDFERTKTQNEVVATEESNKTTDELETSDAPTTPQGTVSPEWEFSVTPYLFLAGLDGTVGVARQTATVDATFRDIFRNLDFAIMGTFEARKGNWMFLGDAMYMKLSGKRVTPSPFFSDINVETREIIIDPEVGYRVLNEEGGSIDLMAGVRFWSVKNSINFQRTILPPIDVEGTENWADPVVGARGILKLTPRTFLTGKFDAGGFGISSDFTGQAFGAAGFQLTPRIALIGGYRYLRVDYVSDDGFVFKTAMSGLVLGAKFKF